MIVLDASAAVELLLGTPRAASLAARVAAESFHAPHVIDLEVISAFRALEARGTVSSAIASRMVADLVALAMTRYSHEALAPRVWQLRGNLTPYDAAYVALAEALRAPLATYDARLAAAPGHRANIELFS